MKCDIEGCKKQGEVWFGIRSVCLRHHGELLERKLSKYPKLKCPECSYDKLWITKRGSNFINLTCPECLKGLCWDSLNRLWRYP